MDSGKEVEIFELGISKACRDPREQSKTADLECSDV